MAQAAAEVDGRQGAAVRAGGAGYWRTRAARGELCAPARIARTGRSAVQKALPCERINAFPTSSYKIDKIL